MSQIHLFMIKQTKRKQRTQIRAKRERVKNSLKGKNIGSQKMCQRRVLNNISKRQ